MMRKVTSCGTGCSVPLNSDLITDLEHESGSTTASSDGHVIPGHAHFAVDAMLTYTSLDCILYSLLDGVVIVRY